MEALISGQAGVAVLIEGNTATSFSIDEPNVHIPLSTSSVSYIFSHVTDLLKFKGISKDKALSELEVAWGKDRIMQLSLLLLNTEESRDIRISAAESIEEFLADRHLEDYLLNRFFMAPLPLPVNEALDLVRKSAFSRVFHVLEHVEKHQAQIRRCRSAWNSLPVETFKNPEAKRQFESILVATGAFRHFSEALNKPENFGSVLLQILKQVGELPNSRNVILMWTKSFKPQQFKRRLEASIEEEELGAIAVPREGPDKAKKLRAHEVLESITKQKQAIVHLIKRGDLQLARRYVDQLIKFQMKNGGEKYAVKSLCDLAQQAKEASNYSLQLELAKSAVDLLPSDGWACGQLGDAFYCLDQYDSALKCFDLADQAGESAYASTGRARILRGQGQFEKALDAYLGVMRDFPKEVIPWIGRAEVLRDMWKLEEALSAYEEAIERFPHEKAPRCGRAAVLKDLGQFSDALKAYQANIVEFPDDQISYAGQADVLRSMGRHTEALDAYTNAADRFPDEIIPRNGRANILREMGNPDQALAIYDEIIASFPPNEFTLCGRAETLKGMGRFNEATLAYNAIVNQFPRTAIALCGKASVLEKKGEFQSALQIYDEAVRKFPRDIVPWSGRAEVLRKLGDFQNALEAYERILARDPSNKRVHYTKASILVAMGRYSDAKLLLPESKPTSLDDWVAVHIRGMIQLRLKNFNDAIETFSYGLRQCPWASERSYFRNALALTNLQSRQLQKALEVFGNIDKDEPLTNVLRMHAHGESGQRGDAGIAFRRVENVCPAHIVPLRDELARRYGLLEQKPKSDDDWIFEQECRALLLRAA